MSDMIVWRPEDGPNIRPPPQESQVNIMMPDIINVTVIETSIDGLSGELRILSLDIHDNHHASIFINASYAHASSKDYPELMFEEKYAHDAYTAFMEKHGFTVIKNHHLETTWVTTHPWTGRARFGYQL
ncbi:hypothetical protein BDR06DRAFT_1004680 [Suillus hirtellus]|nr:hypothetical protein BDR06DRAFT_1004680 [Suillus hirtellus]